MTYKALYYSLILILCITYFVTDSHEQNFSQSLKLVGIQSPNQHGLNGQGIKVGVIDTGIDFHHPDLLGYGPAGRIEGGYDFVNSDQKPLDVNGHGTEVSGIIGANGSFVGVAPRSQLFSYKVSSTGEAVSSEYIVEAIDSAIKDKMNVINISLGVNRTNDELENIVDKAVENGVVVVTASGNNGPDNETIGSPGRDVNAITVGASYNNIASSIVSTLKIGNKSYSVMPMLGDSVLENTIQGKIVYGGYGRTSDLKGLDVKNSILLEKRGSDIKGEKVFFSEKEKNAADRGAKGLIIFNNQSGIFYGEITGPNATKNYTPRIPVISMSGDDGTRLQESINGDTIANLDIFYHPDFVAPFSSRGPVSPFYIKPDLVAPGVYVNTTTLGGRYNLTSGTSIATPHVTGAVAILLQEHPHLDPTDIASLITTTTDPVTDAYGKTFPIEVAGSGRLNITRASSANLIIVPHQLVYNLSYDMPNQTKTLHLKTINNDTIPQLKIQFLSSNQDLIFKHSVNNDTINVEIADKTKVPGDYEGFILVDDSKTSYRIPVLIHVTKGTLIVNQNDTSMSFAINYPEKWSYAKISVIKAGSHDTKTIGITPQSDKTVSIDDTGEYWIQAVIKMGNQTDYAYQTLTVNQVTRNYFDIENILQIPLKQIEIIAGIMIITVVIGLVLRRR
ncbi:MAG: S8 family serine peptidase [Thaumarchaeota archaeon]|nr:S8 family serine peptidase [Nitrososphaerota archaeon]